jgi:hypothetical protein
MSKEYSQLKNEIFHTQQELKADPTPLYKEVLEARLKDLQGRLKPFEHEAEVVRVQAIASRLISHGIKVTVAVEPHEGETSFAKQLREALTGRR